MSSVTSAQGSLGSLTSSTSSHLSGASEGVSSTSSSASDHCGNNILEEDLGEECDEGLCDDLTIGFAADGACNTALYFYTCQPDCSATPAYVLCQAFNRIIPDDGDFDIFVMPPPTRLYNEIVLPDLESIDEFIRGFFFVP